VRQHSRLLYQISPPPLESGTARATIHSPPVPSGIVRAVVRRAVCSRLKEQVFSRPSVWRSLPTVLGIKPLRLNAAQARSWSESGGKDRSSDLAVRRCPTSRRPTSERGGDQGDPRQRHQVHAVPGTGAAPGDLRQDEGDHGLTTSRGQTVVIGAASRSSQRDVRPRSIRATR